MVQPFDVFGFAWGEQPSGSGPEPCRQSRASRASIPCPDTVLSEPRSPPVRRREPLAFSAVFSWDRSRSPPPRLLHPRRGHHRASDHDGPEDHIIREGPDLVAVGIDHPQELLELPGRQLSCATHHDQLCIQQTRPGARGQGKPRGPVPARCPLPQASSHPPQVRLAHVPGRSPPKERHGRPGWLWHPLRTRKSPVRPPVGFDFLGEVLRKTSRASPHCPKSSDPLPASAKGWAAETAESNWARGVCARSRNRARRGIATGVYGKRPAQLPKGPATMTARVPVPWGGVLSGCVGASWAPFASPAFSLARGACASPPAKPPASAPPEG